MNKKGMTLLELLVYMALAALLLAPVIMLMNTSSKNMARDASNTELRVSGRDLLNIIYDDLKNTGFKLDPESFIAKIEATYLDTSLAADDPNRDSSSFIPKDGTGADTLYDELEIIKGRLLGNSWGGRDTVRYYVDNKSSTKELKRAWVSIKKDGSVDKKSLQTLARNVAALQFQYSQDLVYWDDFYNYSSTNRVDLDDKMLTQYIKVILVLKDDKRLAATNNQKITVIDYKDPGVPNLVITEPNQALYERHEIVVPIPNNSLWP